MTDQALRVLHIVGRLDRGGVETWLLQVLRHMDRARFHSDVLVHSETPGALDREAQRLGASIIPCPAPSRPFTYARNLLDILQREPGYDVVHSHVHHFSAFPLALARWAGVPIRVAHSHSDRSSVERSARVTRRMYFRATRGLLRFVPTDRLAASAAAGSALFGPGWGRDERDRVLHYGTDLTRFRGRVDPSGLRHSLGVPEGSFVLGHVGRFEQVKNHAFLVDVMTEVAHRDRDVVLLLVGTGPLLPQVEELVRARGLGGRVIFTGSRSDVPELMRAAMDAFLLPSLYEGLPVVGIEAQAAGLPCIFSSAVTRESSAIPELTQYLGLDDPCPWADAVVKLKAHGGPRQSRTSCLEGTSFDVRASVGALMDVYAVNPARHANHAARKCRGRLRG